MLLEFDVNTSGNTITAELIGTNSDGTAPGPAILWHLHRRTNRRRGTRSPATQSALIPGRVSIGGTSATGNLILSNFIGTDSAGDNLGNSVGVVIGADTSNTIGGQRQAGNTIGFNTSAGISIPAADNLIVGNFIGTDSSHRALGNTLGVSVGGSDNTIGGAAASD